MTESVYLGRFTTEKTPNRRSVTFIPVEDIKELKEPGIYVAVMSQPGRFRYEYQTTYFYVSDLGLHLRSFPAGADAFVSSLTDGKAVSGAEVAWLNHQGRVLGAKETDGDGRASFAERPKGAQVVIARKGGQMSLIALREPALDLSEYDVTGPPYKPTRLYAYSGRNLYRPGENFDVSVIARDADGRPVPAQPVHAVLKRPDGKSQISATWQPDKRAPGYYLKRVDVPADAATGSWTLELRADPADKVPGTVFRFGVEEFLPERMKLDLSSKQASLTASSGFTINVSGTYLYGAPAAGNRLLGVAQFERNRNPVSKKFPGFEFGDVADDTLKTRQEIAEAALDESGVAEIAVDLAPAAKRRSPVTVRATLSLLESGGRPVVRNIERVMWPAPALAGVRPLFSGDYARENSTVEFEVVRVDADGNLKPASALPVRLFREDRHYYWRFEDQRGWTSGFTETDELTETANVTIPAAGRGKLALPVRYGRYRLEILDPETGQSLRYRFYAGWSARSDEAQGMRPDRVALKFDKPTYKDGDTARLTVTPPHSGQALITVEGDRTLWVKRVWIPEKGATIDIPVDKAWKRHDLYVSILVLRPGSEGEQVTPARALGIQYLPLERGDRKLTVTLEAPQKMRPENDLKVRVKVPDAKGEKALVTLSAVDVGILNITRYASPDAHAFFFGKLRYGPDQLDVYGRLIEKMQGQKGKLRFGGDNTPKATRSLPKKVKLVDLFSGPVLLNERGEAEISLPVPDFNGTLRLMAVVSAAERYGAKDAEVTVAAPVVAEIATPRFIAFGDSATVALDLHNLSGAGQKLSVALGSDAGLRVADGRRSVTLKDQQKATLRFAVEAGSAFGLANLRLNVDGQDLKIERTFPLMVQAATPQQQIVRRYTVAPGKSVELREADLGGLHRESVLAHVVLSNQPPIDVRAAVQGLLTYPYGCAEQTTSTAYPHVFIDEETARRFGLKPYTREQRAEMLGGAIGRLTTMQAPAGGFSLWGNVSEYEYWLSAYVTNFLLDTREQGFAVPEAMQKKAGDFLLRGLQEGVSRLPAFSPQAAAEQARKDATRFWTDRRQQDGSRFGALAYGAYVLARESKAPLASLRQLHESRGFAHSGLALVQLGIALRLAGDEPRGDAAIAEGLAKPRVIDYWWGDYGTPLRDAALSYALLDRHQIKAAGKENLTALISSEMEKKTYLSTQEKLALFLVGRAFTAGSGPWTAGVTVRGKSDDVSASGSYYREVAPADLAAGVGIVNTHKEPIYVELSYSGFPLRAPASRSDPIALARTLYTPDGAAIGDRALKT
ncbi:MAG TPA: alpha-2-macroglobulin, partial [Burkholderiales bacterium]|nr:alpha-2-macroglobulin [Burkholderiales bacterium]